VGNVIYTKASAQAAGRYGAKYQVFHNHNYSSLKAFSGQALMHILQFLQFSILTKAFPFSITMVSVGQTSIHAPQAVHFSAITLGYKIFRSIKSGFTSDTVSCFTSDITPGISLRTSESLHSGQNTDLQGTPG
jgi:hypothetical protein